MNLDFGQSWYTIYATTKAIPTAVHTFVFSPAKLELFSATNPTIDPARRDEM